MVSNFSKSIGGSRITANFDGILNLQRMAKKRLYVKVGVLGSKGTAAHKGTTLNNATIGLIHEKGSMTRNIPRRSFLDMPLNTEGQKEIYKNQKVLWSEMIKGTVKTVYKILGVIGENTVHKAFDTGGFGRWAPLKPSTIRRKRSSAILIDTRQLEGSITSEPATTS